MKLIITTLIIVFACFSLINAQNTHKNISAAGGNASGINGKVSYSIGQVFYTVKSGHNGTVSEGVQQPFEISVITGIENTYINLSISAYPNPITDFLILKITSPVLTNLSMSFFDVNGKLLEKEKITNTETSVNTSTYSKGIYMLCVEKDKKTIKSFKIIKN